MYSFVLPFLLTNIAALNVMLYEKYTLLINTDHYTFD